MEITINKEKSTGGKIYYNIPYGLSFDNNNVYDLFINKFFSYKYLSDLGENFNIYFALPVKFEKAGTGANRPSKTVYKLCNINLIKYFDNNTYYVKTYNGDYDNPGDLYKEELIIYKKVHYIEGGVPTDKYIQFNPRYTYTINGENIIEEDTWVDTNGNPTIGCETSKPLGTEELLYKNGDTEDPFEIILKYKSQLDYQLHYTKANNKYIAFQRLPQLKEWTGKYLEDPGTGYQKPFKDYKESGKIFGGPSKDGHPDPLFAEMSSSFPVDSTYYINEYTYSVIIGTDFKEKKYVNDYKIILSELESANKDEDSEIHPNKILKGDPVVKIYSYEKNEFKVLFKYVYENSGDSDDYSYYNPEVYNKYYDLEEIKSMGGSSPILDNFYWDSKKERILSYSKPLTIFIEWTDPITNEIYRFQTHYNIVLRTNNIIWKGLNLVENKLFYESNDENGQKYIVEAGFEFNNKNIKPIYVDDYTCVEWDSFKLFFVADGVYYIDITNISRYDNSLQIFKKFYDESANTFPKDKILIDNETMLFPLAIDYESNKIAYENKFIKVIQKVEAILWWGFNVQRINSVDTNENKILSYKDISNHSSEGSEGTSNQLRLNITKKTITLTNDNGIKLSDVPYINVKTDMPEGVSGKFNSDIYMVDNVYIIPIGTIFNKFNNGEFKGEATETEGSEQSGQEGSEQSGQEGSEQSGQEGGEQGGQEGEGTTFGAGETPSLNFHKNVNGIEINYGELNYEYEYHTEISDNYNQYHFFDILFKKDDKYVNIEEITTYDNQILNNEDESETYDVYLKYNYRMFNTNRKIKYIRYIYDIEWLGLNMRHKFITSLSVLNHFKLYKYDKYGETDSDGNPLIEFSDPDYFKYEYTRLKDDLINEYTQEIKYGEGEGEPEEEEEEEEEEKDELLIYTDKYSHELIGSLKDYPYYYAQLLQGSKTILSLGLNPFDNTDIPENLIEWKYNVYFYKYEYENKEIIIPGEEDEEDTTIIKQVLVGQGWTDGGEETTSVESESESESLVAGKGILFGDGEGTPEAEINPDHKFDNAIRLIPSLDKTKCAVVVNYVPKLEHIIQEELKYPKLDILEKMAKLEEEESEESEEEEEGGGAEEEVLESKFRKTKTNKSQILSIDDTDDEFISNELLFGAGEGPSIIVDINFAAEGDPIDTTYEMTKTAGSSINIWNIINGKIKTSISGGSEVTITNLQNYLQYSTSSVDWTYLFQLDSDNKGPEFRFIRPNNDPSGENEAYLQAQIKVKFTGHPYYNDGETNFTLKVKLQNSNNKYMHFKEDSFQTIAINDKYYNDSCDFSDTSTPIYNRNITCTYTYVEDGITKTATVNQTYSDYSSNSSSEVLLNTNVFILSNYTKPSITIKNNETILKSGYIIDIYTGSSDYCSCACIKKINVIAKKNSPSITIYNTSNLSGSIFSDYSLDGMDLCLVAPLNKRYNTSELVKEIYYSDDTVPHQISLSNLKYDFIEFENSDGDSIITGTKSGTINYSESNIKNNYSKFKVIRYGQVKIKIVFLGDDYNNDTSATIIFNIILQPTLEDLYKGKSTTLMPANTGNTFFEYQFGYTLNGILEEDKPAEGESAKLKLTYKIPSNSGDDNPQDYIEFTPDLGSDKHYERDFTDTDTINIIKYPVEDGSPQTKMTWPIQCKFNGYSEGGKILYAATEGWKEKTIQFKQEVDIAQPIEDLKEELGETISEVQDNIYGLTKQLKLGLGTLTEGVTESIMKSVIKKPEPKTIQVPIPLYVEVIAQVKDEYLNTSEEVQIGSKKLSTSPYCCKTEGGTDDDTLRQKFVKRFIFTLKALDDNEYAVQEEFPSNEHTDLLEIENYIKYSFNNGEPVYKIKVGTDLINSKFDIYGKLINSLTLFTDDGVYGKQVPFYLNTDKPEKAFDLYYECNGDFNELIDCKYLTDKDLYSEVDGKPLDNKDSDHIGIYYGKQFPIYIKYNYRFFKTKFFVEFVSTLYDPDNTEYDNGNPTIINNISAIENNIPPAEPAPGPIGNPEIVPVGG